MAQKFLSIRESDYERIQSKRENAPWIRLHRSLYRDPDFLSLSTHHRYLYTGLLQLAYDTGNRIYNDSTYLGQMLYVPHTEIDLKPLYRSGLLETTNLSRVLSEQIRTDQNRSDGEVSPTPTKVVQRASGFPEGFQFNERAEAMAKGRGLDVHAELSAFKDRNLATGATYIDWQAAFRNWLRNAVKFAAKGGR